MTEFLARTGVYQGTVEYSGIVRKPRREEYFWTFGPCPTIPASIPILALDMLPATRSLKQHSLKVSTELFTPPCGTRMAYALLSYGPMLSSQSRKEARCA